MAGTELTLSSRLAAVAVRVGTFGGAVETVGSEDVVVLRETELVARSRLPYASDTQLPPPPSDD